MRDDHDHEHDDADDDEGPDALQRQDNVTLHTVGIDIGSSGTQVLFSRLHLRRRGEDLSSRYVVVGRETLHRSPVTLTPYADEEHIDAEALGAVIDRAYAAARTTPEQVDTGVVILTGEALRRRNAEAIAGVLAERGGSFVTATAGHHMEAVLAAYGSGAARVSYDRGLRVLNVDIGGGTTKLAVLDGGRVVTTAAVHLGGRLLVVDDGRVVRLDPAGRAHARAAGVSLELGDAVGAPPLDRVADHLADELVAALTGSSSHWLTEPLGDVGRLDGVMFSGGVAEYVYGRETHDFGDLGRRFGAAVRARVDAGALGLPLLPAGECIRATALGASEHSVQLSGNTSCLAEHLLPRRDLPVVRPPYEVGEDVDAGALADAVRRHLVRLEVDTDRDVALALSWSGLPTHRRLLALATGVRDGLAERTARGRPLVVVLDGDVALSLGLLLREELGVTGDLLVLDGLVLRDFDHVDIGAVQQPSGTVPVTIKSLLFAAMDVPVPA